MKNFFKDWRFYALIVGLAVFYHLGKKDNTTNTTTASTSNSAEKPAPTAPAPTSKPKETKNSVAEEPAKPIKAAEEKPIVYVFIQVVADSNKQANNAVAVTRLPDKIDGDTDNDEPSDSSAKVKGDPATEKLLQEFEKVRKELQEKSKLLSKAKSKLETAAKYAHRNHDRQVAQFVVQLKDTIEQLKIVVEELRSKSEALLEKLNET